jgi:hypothetical protein
MINTSIYQDFVEEKLKSIFGRDVVKKEWDIAKDSQDDVRRDKMYCPRIDVAVGPFNISGEIARDNQRILDAIDLHRDFIQKLVDRSETPVGDIDIFLRYKNSNPRCLLAIEIEKSGTRKHLLGDIANVSIIASIGIVVPLNKSKLNGFKGIKKYIEFAASVGKVDASFNNVLVISQDNFASIISE